jgi:DNA-binding transcriptional MerR regulator
LQEQLFDGREWEDELIDSHEVCRLLKVPVSTLHYWRSRGEGPPAANIGKRLKYRTGDVQKFIRERFAEAKTPA